MTAPRWTTARDLGVIEESSYFEKLLVATVPAGGVSYMILSGNLPTGISISAEGLLYGVPTISTKAVPSRDLQTVFTIRARADGGEIADRTFTLLISGIAPPIIATAATTLGAYYDGSYLEYQLEATDANSLDTLTWRQVRGRLPPGITLNSSGLLQGFLYRNITSQTQNQLGWDQVGWDRYVYDFIAQQNNSDYEFTVELSDGVKSSRKTFVIRVIARDILSGDSTTIDADNNIISADYTPLHLPFITTMPQVLPNVKPSLARQDTYFAFKFDGIDFDNEEFVYEITSPDQRGFDQDGDGDTHSYGVGFDMDDFDSSNYPMPTYLGLDNATGWYTGRLNKQVSHQEEFTIQIYARKKYSNFLRGHRNTYKVVVLGQVDEFITWVTSSDLGSINSGTLSGITIRALSSTNKQITYYLKSIETSRTPQGVVLLPNGNLTGRVSFEFFKFDREQTSIDNNRTTFDKQYQFTVVAQTENRSSYSERTFTLGVNTTDKKPYENLYLRGFPTADKRQLFESIMANTELFPPQLIYKPDDPWYGKAKALRFLFLSGVNPSLIASYIESLANNHYTKTVLFGNVKTAVALDNNYNIEYEVVYLDVVDDLEGRDPVTRLPAYAPQTIDLSNRKNLYQNNGITYNQLTPNGLGNMSQRIIDTVGLANNDALPQWMTSEQPDAANPGQFLPPLGYVRAVVLAYTVPGASRLIAYRLKNANFSFNKIPFKTDRYQLDNYLTNNFDIDLLEYIPGKECTIDQEPSVAQRFRFKDTVDYSVTVPYGKIHGQRSDYIRYWDGLDGVKDFKDGDTLIFAQQENFQSDPVNQYVNYDGFGNFRGPSQDLRVWPQTYKNLPKPYVPYDSTRFSDEFDNDYFDHGRIGFEQWIVNDGERLNGNKWVYRTDGWIADLPFDSDTFGSLAWGNTRLIPGFNEYILTGRDNERSGIYRINIDSSDTVTLTLLHKVVAGDIVAVRRGVKYGGKRMYFEAYVQHGDVPRWLVLMQDLIAAATGTDSLVRAHQETTFDQRGTRFFSYRDQYAGPEINDKYIVFPKIGEFV
jgi:hypothetical protein